MALTDENSGGFNVSMPVAPAYGNGGGFGFGDGNGWWILLLFILMGGWGNGFGGYGGGALANDAAVMYPWMNQSNQISDGFRDQMLNTQVTSIGDKITSGFGDVATQLCGGFAGVNAGLTSGFAGVNAAISNGFAQNEIANNSRQIADMQQNFAAQTATMQGFNGIQSQLANCCCENKAGLADLRYTVATEACADRSAISDALRDVIAATTHQTQTILDKMCQQEIDALKTQNLALQNQVNMQALAASQAAQTAALVSDNTAQTQYIVNRVAPYPIPSYTVANPTTPAA